jgi:hypothetical protein
MRLLYCSRKNFNQEAVDKHEKAHLLELHLDDMYRKKLVLNINTSMRYQIQMTGVREGAPGLRGTTTS